MCVNVRSLDVLPGGRLRFFCFVYAVSRKFWVGFGEESDGGLKEADGRAVEDPIRDAVHRFGGVFEDVLKIFVIYAFDVCTAFAPEAGDGVFVDFDFVV